MFGSPLRLPRSRRAANPALVALVILAAAALAACSSTASTAGGPGGAIPPVAAPFAAASAAPATVRDATGAASGGTTTDGNATTDLQDTPLVVRTGSLALQVKSVDDTLLQARAKIIGVGGYVSDSQRANNGDQATALITYRIPAARWDEALDNLRGLSSKVVSEDTKAVEVTGQVLDLGARITNLQATERALQAIMTQATKISDILDVQNQLTSVQGEIEQLSTQKAHLTDQAAMGTLAVTYSVPLIAVAEVNPNWSLSTEFDKALGQLTDLGRGLAVAAVWLGVVGLPIGIVLLVLTGLAIIAARRLGLTRPHVAPSAGWQTPNP